MTKPTKSSNTGSSDKSVAPKQPTIDTSDIPDSGTDSKLGTLRDAIARAKARKNAPFESPLPLA